MNFKSTRQQNKPYKFTTSYYRKVKCYLNKPLGQIDNKNEFSTCNNKNKPTASNSLKSVVNCISNCYEDNSVTTENTESDTSSSKLYPVNRNISIDNDLRNVFFDDNNEFSSSSDYHESSDNDVTNDESEKMEEFSKRLKIWSLKNNITHTALNELMEILTDHGIENLPKHSKTLLSTPRSVKISSMGKGEYWHNGLKKCLQTELGRIDSLLLPTISLTINIDGLPVYRSSKCEFWPILALIDNIPNVHPLIIGIYCGHEKPASAKEFLTPFVNELNEILSNGITVNGLQVEVKVRCFVCDTPARCFVKGTVSSNHYHGCLKCVVIGEYYNDGRHMSYPRINAPLRTDESFRKRLDPDHHKEYSPIEELPIDLVKGFPVADSLHLIDLGITKRCLVGWTYGSFNFRTKWSAKEIEQISGLLEKCNLTMPREIHRSIRKLDCIRFWKGLEFRTFLLYLGPVVLRDHLPTDVYHHFLSLFCAITICSCKKYLRYIDMANELLLDYVETFKEIYGIDAISSNVHNLLHLTEDVNNLGYLPSISSYPFESLLYKIKNLLRNGNRPLAQVAKRLSELANIDSKKQSIVEYPLLKREKISKNNTSMCNKIFHELQIMEGLTLINDNKNKWFLTNANEIVGMINATYVQQKLYVLGAAIKKKEHFFERPFNSSRLNIFCSCGEQNAPKLYSVSDIKCKLISLPYDNKKVFLPLLHTLDGCK